MAKVATRRVRGVTKDGTRRLFLPGDTIPDEYADSITNPAAFSDTETGAGDDGGTDTPPNDPADVLDNYDELAKDDLRAELARRDLPVSGNMSELIKRLRDDDSREED